MGAEDDKKYNDQIELCYKVLGLSYSDPPDRIDSVYRKLKDEYTRGTRAPEPAARQAAKENLEQLEDLYKTITESLIYKDYAREYEKYKQVKEAERQEKLAKAKAKPIPMKICPFCGKSFMASLPACSFCHKQYVSPMDMMMKKYMTTRNIVIIAVVLVAIIAGVVIMLNPQLLKF